jgi:hypothetical protein
LRKLPESRHWLLAQSRSDRGAYRRRFEFAV